MFFGSNITSWDVELPSLTSASWMFRGSKLTEWHIDLPNLTNGNSLFYSVRSLRSFKGDLSRLQDGFYMFLYGGL